MIFYIFGYWQLFCLLVCRCFTQRLLLVLRMARNSEEARKLQGFEPPPDFTNSKTGGAAKLGGDFPNEQLNQKDGRATGGNTVNIQMRFVSNPFNLL